MPEVCRNIKAPQDDAIGVWAVVRTKPNRERVASVHLEYRGVEPFCPMLALPPWHLRAPRGPVPLFPSYVFVRCQPERQFHHLMYCPGVQCPVVFGGVLATVENETVEDLRAIECGRGYILPKDIDRGFAPGKPVRVHSGPLKGLRGVFVEYVNGLDRARILVEFLRRRTSVETEITRLSVVR